MNPWRNTAKPSPPRPRWLNSEDSEKEDKEWPSLHPEIEEKQRERLPDVPVDRLFPSWIRALRLDTHMKWLDQKTTRYDPAVVNAFYSNEHNVVVLPSAILSRPFFFSPDTRPLNYGGVGAVIGHEIMHGYDVTGITIDDEKKKRKWVSPNFLKTYTDKAYCLWESYEDALRHHKRDVKVNDKIDSENLADFVGMVTSYAAMKLLPEHEGRVNLAGLNMTAERMFFINYCLQSCANYEIPTSRYAPQRSRCIVPLMNMPDFSAAFGCELGTPMNPELSHHEYIVKRSYSIEPNSYVSDKRPGPQVEPTDVDGSSLGERNWLKVTFFCLVAALPVTICSLLLALVVFTTKVALEETNTPKVGGQTGPPNLDDPSQDLPIEEVRQQQPWPKVITEIQSPSTTTLMTPRVGPTKEMICGTHDCRILAEWLRSKLDKSAKPCQDFYRYVCGTFRGTNEFAQIAQDLSTTTISNAYDSKVPARNQTSWQKAAGLFQNCVSMVTESRKETGDLVAWMKSLNLDLKNVTNLRRVDAVDMIIRCNLDFGVQVIFSIVFHATWFLNKRRAMQLECSKKDVEWMASHPKFPRPIISGDYYKLLRFYDPTSLDDGGLADKLSTYDDEC
ncbi:uncharacterized protein LOC142802945 [Rhipicephalus microplus]|uniref:uncharacterized protein LOC142802945 n=1 Tax=Rhipicephalus microplus TaxID=6941 RepID=UPI003F6B650E